MSFYPRLRDREKKNQDAGRGRSALLFTLPLSLLTALRAREMRSR